MKLKAQSLIEFAVILLLVTVIAIISLQIISNKINSSEYKDDTAWEEQLPGVSQEESNCTKMGLSWDRQNGICEAK